MSSRYARLLVLFVVCWLAGGEAAQAAERWERPTTPGIWLSRETGRRCSADCQCQLLESLRRLTGWQQLGFTATGWLEVGDRAAIQAGSPTAREVLWRALQSGHVFIIEAHTASVSLAVDMRGGKIAENAVHDGVVFGVNRNRFANRQGAVRRDGNIAGEIYDAFLGRDRRRHRQPDRQSDEERDKKRAHGAG